MIWGIATTTLQTWATKSSPLIWLYFKEGHDSLGNGESLKSAAGAWVTKTLGQKFLKPSDIEVFQLWDTGGLSSCSYRREKLGQVNVKYLLRQRKI